MAGTLQKGSNSVYLFNPDPNKEPCTLSMLDKYPELCRNIGWEGESLGYKKERGSVLQG